MLSCNPLDPNGGSPCVGHDLFEGSPCLVFGQILRRPEHHTWPFASSPSAGYSPSSLSQVASSSPFLAEGQNIFSFSHVYSKNSIHIEKCHSSALESWLEGYPHCLNILAILTDMSQIYLYSCKCQDFFHFCI